MPNLGIYASRYLELRSAEAGSNNSTAIYSNNRLTDLANLTSGEVQIHCYPGAGNKELRWRKVDDVHAAIIPFYIRIKSLASIQLTHCDVQLILSSDIDQAEEPISSDEAHVAHETSLSFVDIPLPISQRDGACDCHSQIWEITSTSVVNQGRQISALWQWRTNTNRSLDHDPEPRHPGVLVDHLGRPLRISCHASGSARRFPFRYYFQSGDTGHAGMRFEPQDVSESARIEDVKAEFQGFLLGDQFPTHKDGFNVQSALSRVRDSIWKPLRNRIYGNTTMTGSSTAHFGDTYNVIIHSDRPHLIESS